MAELVQRGEVLPATGSHHNSDPRRGPVIKRRRNRARSSDLRGRACSRNSNPSDSSAVNGSSANAARTSAGMPSRRPRARVRASGIEVVCDELTPSVDIAVGVAGGPSGPNVNGFSNSQPGNGFGGTLAAVARARIAARCTGRSTARTSASGSETWPRSRAAGTSRTSASARRLRVIGAPDAVRDLGDGRRRQAGKLGDLGWQQVPIS